MGIRTVDRRLVAASEIEGIDEKYLGKKTNSWNVEANEIGLTT